MSLKASSIFQRFSYKVFNLRTEKSLRGKLVASTSHLQWVTHSENTRRTYNKGLAKSAFEHHYAKFMPQQIQKIRDIYIPYDSEFGASALARKLNVNVKTVN